jgi:hypothetical protein
MLSSAPSSTAKKQARATTAEKVETNTESYGEGKRTTQPDPRRTTYHGGWQLLVAGKMMLSFCL